MAQFRCQPSLILDWQVAFPGMRSMSSSNLLEQFHVQFVEAVASGAAAEADAVAQILTHWDMRVQSVSGDLVPISLSKEFLLGVGLAVRFACWEMNCCCFHIEAGLPKSHEFLLRVLHLVRGAELETLVYEMQIASLRLFHDHFVWSVNSKDQLNLGFKNELTQDQLEAYADFIWNNRVALQTIGETQ
jgi:hypothetical protein